MLNEAELEFERLKKEFELLSVTVKLGLASFRIHNTYPSVADESGILRVNELELLIKTYEKPPLIVCVPELLLIVWLENPTDPPKVFPPPKV